MPSPTLLVQSFFPVARSKHTACSVFEFSSGVETNTRLPHTTGVAALGPGKSTVQSADSFDHVDGKSLSSAEPLKCGPRHCGQLPPVAESAVATVSRPVK